MPEIGHLNPLALSLRRVAEIQTRILKSGLAPCTVNRITEMIKAVLNHSVSHGRIPYHPAAGLKKLRENKTMIAFWEESEATEFLNFAFRKYPPGSNERWIYLAYLTVLNTGLRAGELWALRPADIVRDGTLMKITRQFDRVSYEMRPTKGKSERLVPCNPELLRELRTWIDWKGIKPQEPLFQSEEGTVVCHDNFRNRRFERDVRESGLRRIRFHDLRHTAATLMIAKGVLANTAQRILGHESITTTMIYVHLLAKSVEEASRLFQIAPTITAHPTQPEPPKLELVHSA